jgi:cytoskeletal protein CcmA (bactofilin family)
VTGDEDLLIEGRVDGSVDLKQHSVTVGPEGQVKAGIAGRVVTIEGTVEGDLRAEEQVVLRSTASVKGDITAPRVVLEDGATFQGGVEMGDPARASQQRPGQRPAEVRSSSDASRAAASPLTPDSSKEPPKDPSKDPSKNPSQDASKDASKGSLRDASKDTADRTSGASR